MMSSHSLAFLYIVFVYKYNCHSIKHIDFFNLRKWLRMLLLYHLDYNNFHCCKHMSQGWESYHRQSLYKWLYSLFLYSKVFQYHYLHVWLDELRSSGTATWQITDLLQQWLRTTQKIVFLRNVCCVLVFYFVLFCVLVFVRVISLWCP